MNLNDALKPIIYAFLSIKNSHLKMFHKGVALKMYKYIEGRVMFDFTEKLKHKMLNQGGESYSRNDDPSLSLMDILTPH